MRSLKAIKVKIGLKENGHAKYPNFNQIPATIRNNLDWSHYVDTYGLGWHYDKTSGHRESTTDSPYGQQWGVLIVPEAFASEALNLFPDDVTPLTEAELEDFYDNKAHIKEPDEVIHREALEGIKAKQDLKLDLTLDQLRALDPDDSTPGIVKNRKKRWKDFKKLVDVEIV